MEIKITQEKRGEVERIQNEFRSKLSPNEILRGTAQGINKTLLDAVPLIKKSIKERYNINKKYLNRQIKVSPKAKPSRLWGGIKVNQHRIPIIAFNPKQSGSHISVAIRKGKTTMIRHAFIATMTSGHEGVFARGEYQGKNFVRGKFPPKRKNTKGWLITELLTTSSFRMSLAPDIRPKVSRFIGNEVTARIHEKLTSRVNKIAAKNG